MIPKATHDTPLLDAIMSGQGLVRPPKTKDLKEAFKAYIAAGKHRRGAYVKTSREIAHGDLRGWLCHATVLKWGNEFDPEAFPSARSGGEG